MKIDLLKAAVALSVLSACGTPPPFFVHEQGKSVNQMVTVDEKIDILFVVDNSLSMENKQTKVAKAFKDFIQKFSARNLDFQVGVISTEVDIGLTEKSLSEELKTKGLKASTPAEVADYWAGLDMPVSRLEADSSGNLQLLRPREESPYRNFWNAGPGSLLAFKNPLDPNQKFTIIGRDTPNKEDRFTENVRLGQISLNPEQGLKAVIKAISRPELVGEGGWNKDFFRADARLAIIILSDEDESLGIRPNGMGKSPYVKDLLAGESTLNRDQRVESYINEFVSRLTAFKPKNSSLVGQRLYFAVVVNTSEASIKANLQSNPSINPGEVGTVYIETAKRLNGRVLDIAFDDYSDQLAEFGERIIKTLFEEIPIGQVVENQTLRVALVDPENKAQPVTILVENDPNGYVLIDDKDRAREKVVKLVGKGIPTSPTAKIELKWLPREATKIKK